MDKDQPYKVATGAEMFLSVRVERVSELPKGQRAAVELWPDGSVTYYLHKDDITNTGAEALQAVLTTARNAYHQAWDLPIISAPTLTH